MSGKGRKPAATGQRTISAFFQPKPGSKRPSAANDEEQAGKRARQLEASGQGASSAGRPADAPAAPAGAAPPPVPERQADRQARAQAKLGGAPPRAPQPEPPPQQQAAAGGAPVAPNQGGGGGGAKAAKLTPLEQQVVALQAQHPGVLLAIEVGYKIRFFGRDAELASAACNIACFPDHSFMTASIPVPRLPIHVRRLVAAGHKVGIVRQVETAALKSISDNKHAPFQRRLTALYTPGTLEAGQRADKIGEEGGVDSAHELEAMAADSASTSYLLCVAEAEAADPPTAAGGSGRSAAGRGGAGAGGGGGSGEPQVGLLAVETSTGDVMYGVCRAGLVESELEGVLLALGPSEIVMDAGLSAATRRLLSSYQASTPGCRVEQLEAGDGDGSGSGSGLGAAAKDRLVSFYQSLPFEAAAPAAAGSSDASSEAPAPGGREAALAAVLALPPLALRAMDAALRFLRPFGLAGVLGLVEGFRRLDGGATLRLGANALSQLEVLPAGGKAAGSLLHLMDRTATPAGGRLLRAWLAAPLADRGALLRRQEAVAEVAEHSTSGPLLSLPKLLRKLPDLEKGLARMLHGTASPAEVVAVLQALTRVSERLALRQQPGCDEGGGQGAAGAAAAAAAAAVSSPLLASLFRAAAAPEVREAAEQLLAQLHPEAAPGNDYLQLFADRQAFSKVFERQAGLAAAEVHLQALLPVLARQAGVGRLEYVSINNQGSYLVELPATRMDVPAGWQKVCGTKKVNRFHPAEVRQGMLNLEVAREQLQAACSRAWAQFLAGASRHTLSFRAAAQALAQLDALVSLGTLARSPGYCRPRFVEGDAEPRLVLTGARHPMLDAALGAAAVPNDLHLARDGQRCAIITGPNMGGKSCLIRAAALVVIMAQVGSYVPADTAALHVHDAVHTRMGASDNILLGRSTFHEELADASAILAKATDRSLVIMDELGRGTATHDGVAIAAATLEHLVGTSHALTLFVTHYPQVAALAAARPGALGVYHMAYMLMDPEPEPDPAAFTPHQGPAAGPAAAGPGGTPACGQAQLPSSTPGSAPPAGGVSVAALASASPAAGQGGGGVLVAGAGRPGLGEAPLEPAAPVPIPRVLFLFKLVPGAADQSFGLTVARMAGLPASIVQRAARLAGGLRARVAGRQADAVPEEPREQPGPGAAAGELGEAVREVVALLRGAAVAPVAGVKGTGGQEGPAGDGGALPAGAAAPPQPQPLPSTLERQQERVRELLADA